MDLSRDYANSDFIADAASYPPRWAADAALFRSQRGARARLGLPYGPADRQRYDLFMPDRAPRGLVVFIHGGYWLAFGREDWSHFAEGPLAHGFAVAMPSYTLAPEARITEMTQEIGAAIVAAAAQVAGPILVTGHSAGGHLSARMACQDAPLPAAVAARITRVLPISPLADLAPLTFTDMSAQLGLDAAEVAAQSPVRLPRRAGTEVLVWVGGQERPAFLWQARTLSEAWDCDWHVAANLHHFNVIGGLMRPDSPLTQALIA